MPYFVYKILPSVNELVKNLEQQGEFENFKQAKNFVKEIRSTQAADDEASYKIIFADNTLHAEEQLMEKREAPILREWEK